MPRWRLDIAYDGSRYNGWQRQPNAPTVQGAIETVIRKVTQTPEAELVGAGRTDTGVHARGQVAHIDLDIKESAERFGKRLNSVLPADIRIRQVTAVEDAFHARYSAVSRTYRYELGFEADPLRPHRWIVPNELDISGMQTLAQTFLGTHDFRGFATQSDDKENTECTVMDVRFDPTGDGWVIEITANRFLRSMVRRLVSHMVSHGVAGIAWTVPLVAPAHALVLHRVDYEQGGWEIGRFVF